METKYYDEEKKLFIYSCSICGKKSESKAPNAKFCSIECKRKHHAKKRVYREPVKIKKYCHICGNQINDTSDKFCSDECRKEHNREYQRQWRKAQDNKFHTCVECGDKFTGRKKKYCSEECRKDAIRRQNRERYREKYPALNEQINKVCEWCGQAYTVPARNASQARFCSDECRHRSKGHKPMEEYLKELEQQRQERLELSRRNMVKNWPIQEWEYIGGYTKGNSNIKMKCLHCGRIETVKIDDVMGRKTYDCTVECIEEVKHKQEQEQLLEKKRKKKEQWEALPVKKCLICNTEFKSWQPTQMTCSKKCSNKYNKQRKRERGRLRKYDIEIVDHDITLDNLYERDNGVCHLCNGLCDWDDYSRRDGAFIVGPSYPSIDHLIPCSKGGVHSWNNIKLAHHYCNTIKNNNEEVKDTSTEYQRIMAL